MESRRLTQPTLQLLVGNVTYAAGQWLTIVVLARNLGDAAVGYYSLSLALTAPIMLLVGMSLRSLLQAQPYIGSYATFVKARWLASCFGVLLVLGLAIVSQPPLSSTVALIGCAKALDLYGDLCTGRLIQYGRTAAASTIPAANGILTVTLATTMSVIFGSVTAVAAGSLAASVLSSVLLPVLLLRVRSATPTAEEVEHSQPKNAIRSVLRASIPLGLASAIGSLASNIPVYALGLTGTIEEVGAFSAAMSLLFLSQLPLQARQQAEISTAARLRLQQRDPAFRRLIRASMRVAGIVSIGTMILTALLGQELLSALYGNEFGLDSLILTLLAVALVPSSFVWTLDLALWVLQLGSRQLAVNVASAGVGIAIACILFPHGGLGAAVLTVACLSLVQFSAKSFFVGKGLRMQSAKTPKGSQATSED